MNPYEILGVDRDADDDTIKRAYRKASSASHPDREGGSTEEQQRVNDAYAILSDPDKRAEFNATGKVSGDDLRAQAMGMAVSIFLQKLDDPWVFDPIKGGVEHLQGECVKAQDEAAAAARRIAKLQRMADRIKVKQGENILVDALNRAISGLGRVADEAEKFKARANLAIEILLNHELQPDHAGQPSMRIDSLFFNQGN